MKDRRKIAAEETQNLERVEKTKEEKAERHRLQSLSRRCKESTMKVLQSVSEVIKTVSGMREPAKRTNNSEIEKQVQQFLASCRAIRVSVVELVEKVKQCHSTGNCEDACAIRSEAQRYEQIALSAQAAAQQMLDEANNPTPSPLPHDRDATSASLPRKDVVRGHGNVSFNPLATSISPSPSPLTSGAPLPAAPQSYLKDELVIETIK